MALIHIDNLIPGMVLTRNVCDRSGRLLLPAGAELTGKHFSLFRMWGILEAEVAGDSATADGETAAEEVRDPELYAAARDHVQRLFVHNDPEHPAVKELMNICTARRVNSAP